MPEMKVARPFVGLTGYTAHARADRPLSSHCRSTMGIDFLFWDLFFRFCLTLGLSVHGG
jgi:hypothetical protein